MKTKNISIIALLTLMILTLISSSAFAEQTNFDNFKVVQDYRNETFEDVEDTDWFYENIKSVYELNLMVGRSDTDFAIEENMTVAEAFTIAARLNSIYYTGESDFEKTEPWYKAYTDYCEENSIADIANYIPNDYVTRAQFAEIFANALPKEALNEINEIANGEIPDVNDSDSFSNAVYELYRAGILIGNDEEGTFAPNSNIRRMEVAAITARMAVPSQRKIVFFENEIETDNEFNVCFDLNYNEKILEDVTVLEGDKVAEPSKPTRKGYSFKGWYISKAGGSKFDFNQAITADTTVYAHWNKKSSGGSGRLVVKKYTVTFDMQGHGDIPTEPINDVTSGSKIAIPDDPTETGWIFDGWYKEAECTNAWNFDTDKVKSNVTLYAKWIQECTNESQYVIQILSGASDSYKYILYTLNEEKYVKKEIRSSNFADSISIGKYYHANSIGMFDESGTVTECSYFDSHQVAESYTVSFDMNGHGTEINPIFVVSGELAAKPEVPTETDWLFNGWYKTKDETTGELSDEWDFEIDIVTEDITLYANWIDMSACLAAGTKITMADGSLKAIEDVEMGDDVLTFNHITGEKSHAKVYDYYEYGELLDGGLTLHFSNNNDVTVVTGHGFYSKQDQKYVVITPKNYKDYVGKEFFNLTEMKWETFEGATLCEEKLRTFIIVTEKDMNCVANNMLASEDGFYLAFINCFDFDDNMKVDDAKKQADIERWKLYTYEEDEYLTKEAFEALNMQYRNIVIGKGLITEEIFQIVIEMAKEMDPSNLRLEN